MIPSQPKPYKGTHLVVLVHGFQGKYTHLTDGWMDARHSLSVCPSVCGCDAHAGPVCAGNSWDMRLMRNHLALLFPECVYLCSSCNEDKTEGRLRCCAVLCASLCVSSVHSIPLSCAIRVCLSVFVASGDIDEMGQRLAEVTNAQRAHWHRTRGRT